MHRGAKSLVAGGSCDTFFNAGNLTGRLGPAGWLLQADQELACLPALSPPHARKATPNYAQGVTLSFVVDSSGIDILWRHGSHNQGMYLVGHAIVAFLIAFGISKKFKVGGVSFALVMLIACLPDIDILFQVAGITTHKTYTHSLILSVTVVPAVIFAIARWRKVSYGAAFVYSLAYIQHIIIGDIVVGATKCSAAGALRAVRTTGNLTVSSG